MRIIVGSRESRLARLQAERVMARLKAVRPDLEPQWRGIATTGDRFKEAPFWALGERGVFVKELQRALLAGEVDIAVHSLKDLPSTLPPGLVLGAVPEREDPRDVLVSRHGLGLNDLPSGARLGTSSVRRGAFLRAFRPDFIVVPLRGNVDTRLRKALTEDYDGVVLAAAGIGRLGLTGQVTEFIPPEVMPPAPGQGALAVEARADAPEILELLARIDDPEARAATAAERAIMRVLEGGCAVAVGAYGRLVDGRLQLLGAVAAPDGSQIFKDEALGDPDRPEALGEELARRLLAMGAGKVLMRARS
ncbi:MAG: hydroxymethylbilane synthase [Chloroflexota bacterium]